MNGFLLDTQVISELIRPQPEATVVAWLEAQESDRLFLSVFSIGEIEKGIARVTDARRRAKLRKWLDEDVSATFAGQVLPVDEAVSITWGKALAQVNRPLPAIDSLIAATALHHGLTMVTRNEADMELPKLVVFNPWEMN
ncbi:MAG TPA: type II toxin-antitoxin system VapC family toxin [Verrucomicrobiae bacterium]